MKLPEKLGIQPALESALEPVTKSALVLGTNDQTSVGISIETSDQAGVGTSVQTGVGTGVGPVIKPALESALEPVVKPALELQYAPHEQSHPPILQLKSYFLRAYNLVDIFSNNMILMSIGS